jgi:hypothetical protein
MGVVTSRLKQLPLEIHQGEDRSILVGVVDSSTNNPLPISRVVFTLRKNPYTPTYLFQKDSDVVGEATILTQSGSTLGQARIFILRSDTVDLPLPLSLKPYVYDIWVVLLTGEHQIVVPPSPFLIGKPVTQVL